MLGRQIIRSLATAAEASEYIYNRNPRSLEKLCIAYKPVGWHLERPGKSFWHKLTLEKSGRHLTAKLIHYKGFEVITVSTKEWAIRKYLFSTRDKSAYVNLARVMALRCIQSGITEMIPSNNINEEGTNVKAFFNQVESDGISLTEPYRYINPRPSDLRRPEKYWEVVD